MPIRFRCRHCGQLLGIARRKAGSQVRCPTCQIEVEVPAEDSLPEPVPQPPPSAPPAHAASPGLFERDDFEDLLNGSVAPETARTHSSAVHAPAPAARPQPPPPVEQPARPLVPSPMQAPPPIGLVLSPARATVLTVVVILLLAAAFALGLVVGRFVL